MEIALTMRWSLTRFRVSFVLNRLHCAFVSLMNIYGSIPNKGRLLQPSNWQTVKVDWLSRPRFLIHYWPKCGLLDNFTSWESKWQKSHGDKPKTRRKLCNGLALLCGNKATNEKKQGRHMSVVLILFLFAQVWLWTEHFIAEVTTLTINYKCHDKFIIYIDKENNFTV